MLRSGEIRAFGKRLPAFFTLAGSAVAELLLPPCCRLCGEAALQGVDFCADCHRLLESASLAMQRPCRRCGRPRGAGQGADHCPSCRLETLHFDGVIVLWPYQDQICDVVVASKYLSRVPLADAIGRRLGVRAAAELADDPPDVVTFVPSHFTRQISRGGTSVRVMAEGAARPLRIPCRSIVKMARRIQKQAWLDDRQRVENVRSAFSLKRGYASRGRSNLVNRHILLVDDVLTTGATANEISQVLRGGGARRITLAVAARALRTPPPATKPSDPAP